jgi:hypothetical protein
MATTWHHNFSFICIWNCLELSNNCVIFCELILLSIAVNYIGYVLLLYVVYFACFGGSPYGEASKTGGSKKIKTLYSSVN